MEHHRHLVLAASFLQNAVTIGYMYGFNRLLPAMVEEYDWGRAQAGLIMSVGVALFACLGVVTGVLLERFGPRIISMTGALLLAVPLAASFFTTSLPLLIVSCGIFPGIGISFSYIGAPATVGKLYDGKARSLALTIVSSGNSVGAVAYAYIMELLLCHYNVRGTLLICGAIVFNAVWMIMIWPRRKFQNTIKSQMHVTNTLQNATNQVTNNNQTYLPNTPAHIKTSSFKTALGNFKHIFSDKAYVFFAIGTALFLIADMTAVVYMSDFVIDKSGVPSDGSFALFLFSTLGVVGRFLPGFLKQLPRVSVTAAPFVSTVLSLGAKMLILYCSPVIYTMIGMAVSGLCFGVQAASLSVTTAKLVGERYIPVGMGTIFTLYGIGGAILGPLFGYLRDVTGSYVVPYQCSIGILAVSVLLNCASFCIRRRQRHRDQTNNTTTY